MSLYHDIAHYMELGWHAVCSEYKIAKERKLLDSRYNENRLHLYGSVRKNIIDDMIWEACKKCVLNNAIEYYNTHVNADGSINLTSDYDVSIEGEFGPDIVEYCILNYKNIVKNHTGISNLGWFANHFDTNLYLIGPYFDDNIFNESLFVKFSEKNSLITPKSCYDESYQWALAKLNNIDKIKDQRIVYFHQIYYAKEMYKLLKHNSNNTHKIMEFYHLTNYWAMEGYFTSGPKNIVLNEMIRLKKSYNEKPIYPEHEYICCFIENYADFRNHNGNDISYSTLLMTSKYLYRMHYCLVKLGKEKDITVIESLANIMDLRQNHSSTETIMKPFIQSLLSIQENDLNVLYQQLIKHYDGILKTFNLPKYKQPVIEIMSFDKVNNDKPVNKILVGSLTCILIAMLHTKSQQLVFTGR